MMRLAKGLWRGGKATCARFCESASKVLQIGEQMAANRRAWCRKSTSFVGGVTLHSGSTSAALGDRIAAVAEFLRRYLTSHGPATLRDFAWWTKLPLGEIRRALPLIVGVTAKSSGSPVSGVAPIVCALALEVVTEFSSPALVNHCRRSYLWAASYAVEHGISVDSELLYVSAMLHDIGLVEAFARLAG